MKVRIYYEDTDAGGVVYYANYLKFMERARTEWLSENGIEVYEFHNEGCFFIVAHVDIRYRRPARLGEIIEVTTTLKELKKATFTLEHKLYRGQELINEADVTIAFVTMEGKPRRIPERVMAVLEKWAQPQQG